MGHIHSIYDTDPHFSIDIVTRAIANQSTDKTVIIQNDHNSERFTFEMPRYIDGHDMSTCNKVQVHYINIATNNVDRQTGLYTVTDLQLSPEDENVVICSWLVSQNATMLVGTLNFVLRFACMSGSKVDYVWNTAVHSGISVATGINNSEVTTESYADVLESWYLELLSAGTAGINVVNEAKESAIGAINNAASYAELTACNNINAHGESIKSTLADEVADEAIKLINSGNKQFATEEFINAKFSEIESKVLILDSFDPATGILVTKSSDYTGSTEV